MILRRLGIFICVILVHISSHAQIRIPNLSQNTHEYLYYSTFHQIFISSIDGLNIFDGQALRVYKPITHNMYGNNIQSSFYEDSYHHIWFCTYQALHVYNPYSDQLDYYFGKSPDNDTIYNDYRIIDLEGNSLWFLADAYIFEFDIVERMILTSLPSYVSIVKDIQRIASDSTDVFVSVGMHGLDMFTIDHNTKEMLDSFTLSIPMQALWLKNDQELYAGSQDGRLIHFDIGKKVVINEYKVSNASIANIDQINPSTLFISAYDQSLFWDLTSDTILHQKYFHHAVDKLELDAIHRCYVAPDSSMWISDDGTGLYYLNNQKSKFRSWLTELDKQLAITGIYSVPFSNDYLLITRDQGIFLMSSNGAILKRKHVGINNKRSGTLLSGIFIDNIHFLMHHQGQFVLYNIETDAIRRLDDANKNILDYGIDFEYLANGEIVFCDYSARIWRLDFKEDQIYLDSIYSNAEYGISEKPIVSLEKLNDSIFFASENEESVYVLKFDDVTGRFQLIKQLELLGGVKSVEMSESSDYCFIVNSNGLFKVHLKSYTFEQVVGKEQCFAKTIYAIEKVDSSSYWLSSNQGLYYWNSITDSVRRFQESDGLQDLEYNTDAHFQDTDGRLFFGGVNGLNVFYPEEIQLMEQEAPVMISEFMVDDAVSQLFGPANFMETIELPYYQNTVSFKFHAVDYADLSNTRVKYKMEGIDDNYVVSTNHQGAARYPNLPAGTYTFTIIGSNADQVWNTSKRSIELVIHPPYWQTWWFRLISILTILAIVGLIIRNYYKRKIREKDFLLKEQALIISKQKAIQEERNRIAGEMHDDLGGGLTTISYLSQKLKSNALDEKSVLQLDKIITHAKSLVNNMSEIIWAMNARFDTLDNLIAYIRRYSKESLDDHSIRLVFRNTVQENNYSVSGELRRNIFLICKEVIHNAIKHAETDLVELGIIEEAGHLKISISDFGKGMALNHTRHHLGNGIENIKNRVEKCQGTILMRNDQGLHYEFKFPLKKPEGIKS